ncbi:MAG TPA: hypothetical protein VD866_22690 [Urbifossiella sp.]|nr:hypothetical protein [Urbifossiella sp.]
MKRIEVERKVDADGVLRLEIPMGAAEAGRPVRVTATALPWPLTPEEYRRAVLAPGGWVGSFERDTQEQPEPQG